MKAKLSMAFQDLRGKDGTVVIKNSRQGLIVTPHVTPKNPRTTPQRNVRGYFSKSAKTFEGFDESQVQNWDNYAQTLDFTDPITGKSYHPTAMNAFMQLATKFLQLTPAGTIPTTPPTSEFAGDTITVECQSETPGILTFSANAANAAGVTTELLIQPLANSHNTPSPLAYRHAAWKAYTSGSLDITVAVGQGAFAAAYRFVKNSTGQMTDLVVLPVVEVSFFSAEATTKTSKQLKKAA